MERARLEQPLLRHYYDQLQAQGVQHYTWADCVYDYQASIIRFLAVMVLYWQHEVNRKRLLRGLKAFIDWNCEEILG